MIDRPVPRRARPLVVVGVLAVAWTVVGPGLARAQAEPPIEPVPVPVNVLDRERADALMLTVDPDDAPRALVIDPPDPTTGVVIATVLERGPAATWTEIAADTITLPTGTEWSTPWLIGMDEHEAALVASSDLTGASVVVSLHLAATVDPPSIVRVGAVTTDDAEIDDAGAADVDGDGRPELIVANVRTSEGVGCRGSRLRVIDPATGSAATLEVPGVRLGAGVIGRFDDAPGDDLAAYAVSSCSSGGLEDPTVHLRVIRLADGATILDRVASDPGAPTRTAPPVRLDVDGDGRHELLAHAPFGLAIYDPIARWDAIRVASDLAIPVGATRAPVPHPLIGAEGVAAVWFDPTGANGAHVTAELIRREPTGNLDSGPAIATWAGPAATERWSLGSRELAAAAGRHQPPPILHVERAGDPCADLVVPFATVTCETGPGVPEAAWIGSRPIAALPTVVADGVDDGPGRLLAAVGVARQGLFDLPAAPTPWAGGPPGWWRHGPSAPFVLAEVWTGDPGVASVPFVHTQLADGPAVRISAPPGMRLVITVEPRADGTPAADPAPAFVDVAGAAPGVETVSTLVRVPVAPGATFGGPLEIVEIDIGGLDLGGGRAPERWDVTVLAIDDRGEPRPIHVSPVRLDRVPPSLDVRVPVLTPVWPFAARLTGRVEPGSSIDIDGRAPVTPSADGTFVIEAVLAPWPQTLLVTARDAVGNETIRTVDVVGGFDYRTVPWAPVAAGSILIAATLTGILGRRRRPGAAASLPADVGLDGPGPEVEDLP